MTKKELQKVLQVPSFAEEDDVVELVVDINATLKRINDHIDSELTAQRMGCLEEYSVSHHKFGTYRDLCGAILNAKKSVL